MSLFFSQRSELVLRSLAEAARLSPAGGSRDGRSPPCRVSARADGRLTRGPASPCARTGLDGNSPLSAALLRHWSGVPPVSVTRSRGAFTHRWIPFVRARHVNAEE